MIDQTAVRFDGAGLVAVVAQDRTSGVVLMVGWANAEALDRTVESSELWFWKSVASGVVAQGGATLGNRLVVRSLHLDCDGDTILALVDPVGPACHTGSRSCFEGAAGVLPQALELGWLAQVVATRAANPTATSYTAKLLERGRGRVAQKVGEEATEVVIAAQRTRNARRGGRRPVVSLGRAARKHRHAAVRGRQSARRTPRRRDPKSGGRLMTRFW